MNTEALNFLKKYKENISKVPISIRERGWESSSVNSCFRKIKFKWKPSQLSNAKLTRNELIIIINQKKIQKNINSIEMKLFILEILAWGGIRFHKDKIVSSINIIEKICFKLFNGEISRLKAYEYFNEAQLTRKIIGLGPAYYTKLIFFFGDQTGLIMDQWTARSINLLSNKKIVLLSSNYVNPKNNVDNYKSFLYFFNIIKNELKLKSLMETEELVFSCSDLKTSVKKKLGKSHKICSSWRKFVKENT